MKKYIILWCLLFTGGFVGESQIDIGGLFFFGELECGENIYDQILPLVSEAVEYEVFTSCMDPTISFDITNIDSSELVDFGACFASILVEISLTDNCGNSEDYSDSFTVEDFEPPTILAAYDVFDLSLSASTRDTFLKLVNNNFGITVDDNCDSNPEVSYELRNENGHIVEFNDVSDNTFGTYSLRVEAYDECFQSNYKTLPILILRTVGSFVNSSSNLSESNQSGQVCISLENPLNSSPTVVNVGISGGQAEVGVDIEPISTNFDLTFLSNETHKCFTVTTIDDDIIDANKFIEFEIVEITSAASTLIGNRSEHRINIIDNDDNDGDGVNNLLDNCPEEFNPEQLDIDGDGIGNICDGENTIDNLLEVEADMLFTHISSGVVLRSSNGKCWKIIVTNTGELSTFEVVCP